MLGEVKKESCIILKEHGLKCSLIKIYLNTCDSIHKTKNEIYEDFLTESKIEVRPGIKRLIKELREQSIKIGLVSSTSEINLLNLFEKGLKIDCRKIFDIIAHGDSTPNKKPSPEIYEWALEKLRLPAQACIAIEDSPRGLDAATKANIKTIVTPSMLTLNEKFKGAKLVIPDLENQIKILN